MTVDDIIANRLKLWFPTIDIGAAVDIARVRKDLEKLVASTGAELLAEGQVTKDKLLASVETLPRYEPELAITGAEEVEIERDCDAGSHFVSMPTHEAVMVAKPAGEPASFVAIQDLRRVLG